ncbi:helix-turn-helix domain-containing protein [Leptotrichia trevisanii]|uniref:AraC family transcriptional regulator n=1 Tax=Leptotrichia trevisanii TaxID=109328 RepID=A0A510K262_9FUSO|nr:AraC family transcriptional regulator [Leptotrichia trevisanii]BBM45702.1 AraC family transcriptional regulator [Leptotrichia trevisanii]
MKITMPKQFQDFLKSIGLSIENILEQAGIPNILWKEEIQLSTEEYYLFLKKIDEVITDEQISAISNIDNLNVFIPSFFAALSSKNGLEGLKRLAKYKKLIGPVFLEIKEFEEIVQVQYFFEQREKELPRFAVLNEQLMLINLLNKGIGKEISPVSVTSPFEYGELLTKEINATINKAKQNEVIFSMKDLKKPFLTANNIMMEYLEPQLKQKLAEMESETFETFASRVQKKLFQLIPSGQFGLENVAEEFGISGRTLQRNLAAENTSFNQMVKDIQKIMTFNYLEAKELSIDEIAYLVGYTETSSFYRAFKKWTGKTVSQYQKEKK